MRTPRGVPGHRAVRLLVELGYRVVRQKGSHARLRHDGPPGNSVTAPMHASLKIATLQVILVEVANHLSVLPELLVEKLQPAAPSSIGPDIRKPVQPFGGMEPLDTPWVSFAGQAAQAAGGVPELEDISQPFAAQLDVNSKRVVPERAVEALSPECVAVDPDLRLLHHTDCVTQVVEAGSYAVDPHVQSRAGELVLQHPLHRGAECQQRILPRLRGRHLEG